VLFRNISAVLIAQNSVVNTQHNSKIFNPRLFSNNIQQLTSQHQNPVLTGKFFGNLKFLAQFCTLANVKTANFSGTLKNL
jgi:hypothetical protein